MPVAPIRILAIDDDPDILMVLKANLELYEFSLETAETLTEARRWMAQSPPELVLLDLTLPDGDGMDFCCYIKTLYPRIPVIMLTARDALQDKVEGLRLGADDYVAKPFETLELLARIRARIRTSALAETAPLAPDAPWGSSAMEQVGEVRLDLLNQTAMVRGREIDLTPRQFAILALLVRNSPNLVTRKQIQQQVWGDVTLYSWSRAIDVHITHLRRKIEIDPSSPRLIITIPRKGYRFAG